MTGWRSTPADLIDWYKLDDIDLTGAPVGVFYLASTTNPDGNFLEANLTNNTAWVSFRLTRDSRGNPKIVEIGHSACNSPGMCGEQATNR